MSYESIQGPPDIGLQLGRYPGIVCKSGRCRSRLGYGSNSRSIVGAEWEAVRDRDFGCYFGDYMEGIVSGFDEWVGRTFLLVTKMIALFAST